MGNEGMFDRLARVALGLIILSLAFWGPKTALGWLGLIPLATGIVGLCPLYSLLGISTRR